MASTTGMGLEQVRIPHEEKHSTSPVSGMLISVERVHGPVIEDTDGTSDHEACHVLAAQELGISVDEASNVPGPGYNGYTAIAHFDPIVAAAAEAMHCDGTGHDLWSIAKAGFDPAQAVSAARSLLSGRKDELSAIATAIHRGRTVSGAQMRAHRARLDSDLVHVRHRRPDGTSATRYASTQGEHVHVPLDMAA